MGSVSQNLWEGMIYTKGKSRNMKANIYVQTEDTTCFLSNLSATDVLSRGRLCNPTDYTLPGSSVHGIFQVRILEWVAISFSTLPEYSRAKGGIDTASSIPGRRMDLHIFFPNLWTRRHFINYQMEYSIQLVELGWGQIQSGETGWSPLHVRL